MSTLEDPLLNGGQGLRRKLYEHIVLRKVAIVLDTLINDPRAIRPDGEIDQRYLVIKLSTTIRTISKILEKLNELSSGILLRRVATPIVRRYAEPLLMWLSGRISFQDERVQKMLELVTG